MPAFFDYRGGKIAYTVKGHGRTVLFIHGFLGDQTIWNAYTKALKSNFRTITIDLPGHGKSDVFGYVHQMEYVAELIQALLKELNVRRCVLVGHSLGGYISLAFAELFPDQVISLVMLNSTARGDGPEKNQARDQLIQLVKKDQKKALQLLVPTFFRKSGRGTHLMKMAYLKKAMSCKPQGIIAAIEGMKHRKEREIVLKFAPFPFLFIAGELDEVFNYKDLESQSRLNEKGQYLLLKASSHMSVLEEKEKIISALKSFVNKGLV